MSAWFTCIACNARFSRKFRATVKYCSDACRNPKALPEGKACEGCGKPLKPRSNNNHVHAAQRYCSRQCSNRRNSKLVTAEA